MNKLTKTLSKSIGSKKNQKLSLSPVAAVKTDSKSRKLTLKDCKSKPA